MQSAIYSRLLDRSLSRQSYRLGKKRQHLNEGTTSTNKDMTALQMPNNHSIHKNTLHLETNLIQVQRGIFYHICQDIWRIREHNSFQLTHLSEHFSFHVFIEKLPVKIIPDCIIDKSLCHLWLTSCLVLENDIIIPPSFYRE